MPQLRHRKQTAVTPSARDPIAQWLDVLISMLAVPPKQRARIRDELEDHLRTRTEDLMMLGHPEPQAIQQAVKELGETAELAQRFQLASNTSTRRTIMQITLLAAAGLAVTLGAFNIASPTAAPTQPAAVIVQDETRTLGVDLPAGTLDNTLTLIAQATGENVFVHWRAIEDHLGLDREASVEAIPASTLQGPKVLEILNASLGLEGDASLDVRVDDGLVEVAPRAYFDRVEMVTLDHDVSELVPAFGILETTAEAETLRENIMLMIEPEVWHPDHGVATIAITGSRLSVRAPERIQVEVAAYIVTLQQAFRDQQRQREMEKKANQELHEAMRDRSAARLMEVREQTDQQLANLSEQLEQVSLAYWENYYTTERLEEQYGRSAFQEDANPDELLPRLIELKARTESIDVERDLLKNRIHAAQARIMQLEEQLSSYQ